MILLSLLACAQPARLQYDFARAYNESARIQADLTRPSVAGSLYPLSGVEGTALRENAAKETTDVESGDVEAVE